MPLAYEEVVDFLAGGATPAELVAFEASTETKARVADLIRRQKMNGLTEEEESDLNHFLHVEHILRLAKAKARVRSANGG